MKRMKIYLGLAFCLFLGCGSKTEVASPSASATPGRAEAQGVASQPPATTHPAAQPPAGASQAVGEQKQESKAAPAGLNKKLDPCALITKSEVKQVQGEAVVQTKSSEPASAPMAVSQCYYQLPSLSKSVSLEVVRNAPGTEEVAAFWQHKIREAKKTKGAEKPEPVPGVGDEAYWVGNDKIGALYALKGDAYVRVSVGGPYSAAQKLEKSKALAVYALKRL